MTNLPLSVKTSQNLRSGKGKRHLLWCFDALRLSCSLACSNCHMWSQHDHGQISWYFTSLAELLLIYIYIWLIDYLLTVRMSHWSLDSYLDFCPEDAGIPHARSLPSFDACTAAGISRDGFSGRKRARRDWMLNEFLLVILWCVFWGLFLFVSWCIVYCLLSCFGWVRSVRKIVDSRYPRSALLPSVHYSIFSPPQYIQ